MNKLKRERAEGRAEEIAATPLNQLKGRFHLTNYSGRFNAEDHVSIRVSKDRSVNTPDIFLRISDDKIELGSNFNVLADGRKTWGDERHWETVSKADFSKRLNALCEDLTQLYTGRRPQHV